MDHRSSRETPASSSAGTEVSTELTALRADVVGLAESVKRWVGEAQHQPRAYAGAAVGSGRLRDTAIGVNGRRVQVGAQLRRRADADCAVWRGAGGHAESGLGMAFLSRRKAWNIGGPSSVTRRGRGGVRSAAGGERQASRSAAGMPIRGVARIPGKECSGRGIHCGPTRLHRLASRNQPSAAPASVSCLSPAAAAAMRR
jgi:hypothetical protein